MSYEERIRIHTPEGIHVELPLAGLGSRLAAALIDRGIQILLLLALAVVVGVPLLATDTRRFAPAGILVYVVGAFAVLFGYHVLFETMRSGRTPGKRMLGIRVARAGGGPVTLRQSVVRNLLRLVDQDLSSGIVAIVSILVTRHGQRVGDLAAGTIVVRDEREVPGVLLIGEPPPEAETWDVAGITSEDVAALSAFLQRRVSLDVSVRARLAWQLAGRLRPRVVGAEDALDPEAFLDAVYALKARGR